MSLDSNYFFLPRCFNTPIDYTTDVDLQTDLDHPELNSWAFKEKAYRRGPSVFNQLFTKICQCDDGRFLLASNSVSSTIIEGSVIGCKDFETIEKRLPLDTLFHLNSTSSPGSGSVAGLLYLGTNLVNYKNNRNQSAFLSVISSFLVLGSSDEPWSPAIFTQHNNARRWQPTTLQNRASSNRWLCQVYGATE